jgi:hypothetical protein
VLALLVPHPSWGTIALPLLARLYVRAKDLPTIGPKHRPAFRTKLQLAVELVEWAVRNLKRWGRPIRVVVDGAYAKAPFLKAVQKLGVTIVSRVRKDAALRTVPGPRRPGQRGRTRIYGRQRISLAGRARKRQGWTTETFDLYGQPTSKTYKTFLATWGSVTGAIRVVLVRERTQPQGWVAFFCTDAQASVGEILGAVADRFALEIAFRELKQVVGAGQQQVRFYWASIGSFHMCLWSFTLTEVWAWERPKEELVDRSASPWDRQPRRPSHADKRRAWRRAELDQEIHAVLRPGVTEAEIGRVVQRLLDLAA